jgi:indolepyruvate ferredoxin oxidoreductase alpha subunit
LFWALKDALRLDGQEGVLAGDIGCYGSGVGSTGFKQLRTMHSMGSGIGVANGLGKLEQFGFKQPVLATCGDSTFFHAAIPAVINGIHSKANFILLLLDNSGTAMTGFQPHPGIPVNALGDPAPAVDLGKLCSGLGVPVEIVDPYNIEDTTRKVLNVLRDRVRPRVIISRRECSLMRARSQKPLYRMDVSAHLCRGETCGCNRFCTRVFRCPGLMWNTDTKKVEIDQAICVGCGVCVDLCPHAAITREEIR